MHPRLAGLRLVAITDPELPDGELLVRAEALASACAPGALAVQLRHKQATGAELAALARALLAVLRPRGALLLINDRVDVALAVGADGVHLPEAGLEVAQVRALAPALLIGVSRHSAQGAVAAARAGAALVQLGPIHATPSKAAYGAPLGLEALAAARAAIGDTCLVAVGGMDRERATAARAAGAHAVAAIRAAWRDGADELCLG